MKAVLPLAAAAGAALLAAGTFAHAQQATPPAGTGRQEQSAAMSGTAGHSGSEVLAMREFVALAASDSMYETEAARLALERSRDDAQRRFAQDMIEAHRKAMDELRGLLGGGDTTLSGVRMPQEMAEQHRTWLSQLRAAPAGDNFQSLYAQQQAQAHLVALDLFRNYSQAGDNETLKRWAASRLPTLQEHFRKAQALKTG